MTQRFTKPRSTPALPRDFSPDTTAWLEAITSTYVLEDHHLRLLTLAAQAWDRCAEAGERLAQEGLTISGREGIKAHPCISIERDSRAAFARLIKQLGLDNVGEPHRSVGRPAHGLGVTFEQLRGLPEKRPGKRPRRDSYGSGFGNDAES
jgi:hypothetical protein